MPKFIDQTGTPIVLHQTPNRIISLVPSQTELLYDLGLGEKVVGITKFCIHPQDWFRTKTRVGGTKQLRMDIILELQPDLIIGNKEENEKEQIEKLQKEFPVWVSDIKNLSDAYEMISAIGDITGASKRAEVILNEIKTEFYQLTHINKKKRCCYLIWRDPYMTIGGDTFIDCMIEAAGFENIYKNSSRYPEINIEELRDKSCELLFLSSEPFPFGEKHINEIKEKGFEGKVLLVDGELFSWYGSRMKYAPGYFLKVRGMIDF